MKKDKTPAADGSAETRQALIEALALGAPPRPDAPAKEPARGSGED